MGGTGFSSKSQGSYGSSHVVPDVVEVNDSVYELYKPPGMPSLQVVFVHGLQPGSSWEWHLSTWRCEDGSSVWPQTWLVEVFPQAHVFSVSLSGVLQSSSDSLDMYVFREEENLISDLLMANIGQVSNCPLVLVGHSFGGLVIKSLCYQMHQKLLASHGSEETKLEKFLENLRGIFYYSTPHDGILRVSSFAADQTGNLADQTGNSFMNYFETFCTKRALLNDHFDSICKFYQWQTAGFGESLRTRLSSFPGVVVPVASAGGSDFNVVEGADHFSICRPRDKTSRSFCELMNFLRHIVTEMEDNVDMKAREDAEHAKLRSLEDAKIPLLQTEEDAHEDSATMSVLYYSATITDMDCDESQRLVETPQCDLTDGKRPDVILWRPEMMKDFITEVNISGESGYFVCKTWLFSVQEHEREEVMLVLQRSGYLETYQTSTTMFYERMEDDVQIPNTGIDPAYTTDNNDIRGDSKEIIASDDIGALGKTEETVLNAEKHGGTFHLTSKTEPDYSAVSEAHPPLSLLRAYSAPGAASVLSNETYPMESSSSLLDDQAETSLARSDEILMSLMTAVQNCSLYNYCISTHWLSTLEDHQIKDLYSIFSNAGYLQKYKTSTTTYFEYTRGRTPSSPATQRETANTEKNNIVNDKKRPREVEQSGDLLFSDNQGLNREFVGSTNVTHASPKADAKCVCPAEYLTVSFKRSSGSPESPSTSSSQGQHVSTRSVRRRGLDCNVEIPRSKGYTLSTSVDTDISMKAVEYDGTSGWKEVDFGLNVRAETALRCCLRSDYNKKRVRIELTKIGGALKMDSESSHVNTHTLVLKAVRANLYASLSNRLDDAEGPEGIHLEGLPQRKVLKDFRPSDDKGQSKCPQDLLWLERAEEHPENAKTDSTTLELQCHVRNRLLADLEVSSNKALVLDYSGSAPVSFEGEIFENLDRNSFLELEVRYQSEISYIEPRIPLPPPETPYGIFRRVEKVVDYDCLLKFNIQPRFVL